MMRAAGRHSAGGDLPVCPRAGSGGGEIRRGNPELYVIVGLSFIGGSNCGFAASFLCSRRPRDSASKG